MMLLNGKLFAAGSNVWHFLRNRYLMYSLNQPFLVGCRYSGLISTICIDELNLAERSQQVSIMKDIYRNAAKVLIFLDIDESQDHAMATGVSLYLPIIKIAASCLFDDWNIGFMVQPWHKQPSLPPLTAGDWNSLEKLFSCHWFERVWVIQEVVVSKNAVVILDNLGMEFDWHILGQAAARMCSMQDREAFAGLSAKLFQRLYQAAQIWLWTNLYRETGKLPNIRLFLRCSPFVKATDPKDRIYVLLGVSQQGNLLYGPEYGNSNIFIPEINYEKSLIEVYSEWTRYFIECSQSLEVFSESSALGIGTPEDAKSWVPHKLVQLMFNFALLI
jgi:hypothetical protein